MCIPHWPIHDPLEIKKSAQIVVPHSHRSYHRLVSDVTNNQKTASEIADLTKKTWFTIYALPQQIVFDRGTEVLAEFSNMCQNDYGL